MFQLNNENVKYPFYLTVHPFNGFWELKYERSVRTNLILSFIILFLLIMTNVLSSQYSGFVINLYNPEEMNSLMEVVYVLVPVLFWCIANWSLTTLMDGEGKFVEIFISTCFALTPLVIINFPWIWLSNFISLQEATFFLLLTKHCCCLVLILTVYWKYDCTSIHSLQNSNNNNFDSHCYLFLWHFYAYFSSV